MQWEYNIVDLVGRGIQITAKTSKYRWPAIVKQQLFYLFLNRVEEWMQFADNCQTKPISG